MPQITIPCIDIKHGTILNVLRRKVINSTYAHYLKIPWWHASGGSMDCVT